MFRNYLKIAWRNLLRNKVYSSINIGGLAIGLTCCMLIILYTKDEVSFDQFHAQKDRIYRIVVTAANDKETRKMGYTNAIHGPSFKQDIPEIQAVVRMQTNPFVVRKGTDVFEQDVIYTDDNFFSVFSLPLLSGNPKTVLSSLNSVVITEKIARKYFSTANAVGKTLELKMGDKFEPFVVSGVAEDCPQNSTIQFEVLLPFKLQEKGDWTREWIGFYLSTYVVLNPKATLQLVVPKLDRVFLSKAANEIKQAKEKFNFNDKIHFDLQPLLAMHLDTEYADNRNGVAGISKPIYAYILSGIALFILLIACINFVNLSVAQSLKRSKEVGIRKVVGSKRQQLIYQFLGESFLLSFLAFVLAILLAQLVLPLFNTLANKQLSLDYLLDATLIVSYIGLFLVTSLVAGFYPSLVLSGFSPAQTLYNRTRLAGGNYMTKGLVVVQFALSVILVIGTIVIYLQFNYLTDKNLGYNDKNLLGINLNRQKSSQVIPLFKNELSGNPAVELVAAHNGNFNATVAKVDGKDIEFTYFGVDDNYLPAFQIPLAQGRNFSKTFPSDPVQSVLINETFAKAAGWENPLGKQVDFFWKNQKCTVIGVVKDYHYENLKTTIKPLLFTQDPNYGLGQLWLKLKPGTEVATIKTVEALFRKLVPFTPFRYEFMDQTNAKNYAEEARWKQVITLAALLSIFVSCIGLFGLATFSAETRTKEIGIRKVMGASLMSIVTLLSKDFLALVLLAILIASPVAYYVAQQWLTNFPYRIDISWWVFALAGLLAVGIALLTVSFQSVKAALMNPAKSLRSE